jgi:hypothetical protein
MKIRQKCETKLQNKMKKSLKQMTKQKKRMQDKNDNALNKKIKNIYVYSLLK